MPNTQLNVFVMLIVGSGLTGCDKTAVTPSDGSGSAGIERRLEPTQVTRGKAVYDKFCLGCHGVNGKGQPGDWRLRGADGRFPPPPLDSSAHAWHHPTAVLLEVIREGSPDGEGNMPAWKDKLSNQQMQDVVIYIKSLWSDEVYALWWKMEQQSLEP